MDKEENLKTEEKDLKTLFESNTNLFTLFGIFEAIMIYCQNDNNVFKEISALVTILFGVLSLIVLSLILKDFFESKNIFSVLIGAILYFIQIIIIFYLFYIDKRTITAFFLITIYWLPIGFFLIKLIKRLKITKKYIVYLIFFIFLITFLIIVNLFFNCFLNFFELIFSLKNFYKN